MQLPVRKRAQLLKVHEPDELVLSAEAIESLQQEQKRLLAKRPEAIAEVRRTAEMGDFSENAAYQMAKGRLRGINDRLLIVQDKLTRATLLPQPKGDRVELGSIVSLSGPDDITITYRLVGPSEADISKGFLSYLSPLGMALVGRRIGESVEIHTMRGIVQYTVVGLE